MDTRQGLRMSSVTLGKAAHHPWGSAFDTSKLYVSILQFAIPVTQAQVLSHVYLKGIPN